MAALERLPAEVIALIAKQVRASLAPLATTSRQLKTHVESLVFRSLNLTASDILQFERIVDASRFRAVRSIVYHIDYDVYQVFESGPRRVSASECAAHTETFTHAIESLFTVLKNKADDVGASHPGISLSLTGNCVPLRVYLDRESEVARIGGSHDGGLRRAWLRLLKERLATDLLVTPVTSFSNDALPRDLLGEKLWPSSWSILLSRFPRLAQLRLELSDNERKDFQGRRDARDAFGRSFELLPQSLNEVSLAYHSSSPGNELVAPPVLTDPTLGYDVFSRGIGILSQRLVKLELRPATLDLIDFFRSGAEHGWPRLRELMLLDVEAASPNGTWYFDLDPRMTMEEFEEDCMDGNPETLENLRLRMDEEDLPAAMDVPYQPFRTATNPAHFKEVYLAAAEAVRRMPELCVFEIWFNLLGQSNFGRGEHELRYLHGRQDRWCSDSRADIKVGWGLVPMIEIDDEVLQAWRDVGVAKNASIELFARNNELDYDDFELIKSR